MKTLKANFSYIYMQEKFISHFYLEKKIDSLNMLHHVLLGRMLSGFMRFLTLCRMIYFCV